MTNRKLYLYFILLKKKNKNKKLFQNKLYNIFVLGEDYEY